MQKKNIARLAYGAVGGLLIYFIWSSFFASEGSVESPKAMASAGAPPSTVKIEVIAPRDFDVLVFATGSLVANQEVALTTEASGKIIQLNLQEGERVNKGQLLLKLNDADLQAQLNKLKTRYKEIQNRDTRQKAMLDKGAISQQEFELFEAEKQGVEADMQLLQAQIEKTEIRAPFSGKVGLRYVSLGAFVNQNANIAQLVNADPILVDFAVPEKYATMVKQGTTVQLTVENQADTFSAKVIAVAPSIDANSRTLSLRARLDNSQAQLVPGAFARVELRLRQLEDAILIPSRAIVPELKAKKVFLIKNGVVTPIYIETRERTDDRVRVSSGLNAGDTLITAGILKVRPGQLVNVLELDKK